MTLGVRGTLNASKDWHEQRDGPLALVVTHDPLVADRADRVLTLRDGRLLD